MSSSWLELADLPARPPQVRLLVDRRRLDHQHERAAVVETRRARRAPSRAASASRRTRGSARTRTAREARRALVVVLHALGLARHRHRAIARASCSARTARAPCRPALSVASSSAVPMTLKPLSAATSAHRFRRLAFGGLREVLHRRRRARCRERDAAICSAIEPLPPFAFRSAEQSVAERRVRIRVARTMLRGPLAQAAS